jgi:hypothetical protein
VLARTIAQRSFSGFKCFYMPWIARTWIARATAQVRTEPAIIIASGFAIAIPPQNASGRHIPPKCVLGVSVVALRPAELRLVGKPQGGAAAPHLALVTPYPMYGPAVRCKRTSSSWR